MKKSSGESGNFKFKWTKNLYQKTFKYITVFFAFLKAKDINICLKQHQKQVPVGTRENIF